MSEQIKVLLTEDEMPKQWYNIQADLPHPLPPPVDKDGKPIGPDALAPVFPMNLIEQEMSTQRWIDIPREVMEILALWRPTPLFRARGLEKALKTLLVAQRHALEELQTKAIEHFEFLYEQIALMRRRQFGASSEQMPGQPWLFDEAEALAASAPGEDSDEGGNAAEQPQSTAAKRARGKRAMLPPELPRVEIVHDVPEADRVCACGTPMVEIGEDVSEQLDIIPMKIQVLRHIRKRYGCPGGEHAQYGTHNRLAKIATPAHPLAYLEIIAIDPGAPSSDSTVSGVVVSDEDMIDITAFCALTSKLSVHTFLSPIFMKGQRTNFKLETLNSELTWLLSRK